MNPIKRMMLFPITSRHNPIRKLAQGVLCVILAVLVTFAAIRVANALEERDTLRQEWQREREKVGGDNHNLAKVLADKQLMRILCAR